MRPGRLPQDHPLERQAREKLRQASAPRQEPKPQERPRPKPTEPERWR